MKKLLALMLAIVLVFSAFAACDTKTPGGTDEDNAVVYDLDSATAYVEALYKEDLATTAVDFTVVPQVMVGGVTYQVSWSVDTDKVTVTVADGKVVVDVDEKSPEEVKYKLTATVTAGDGTSKDVSINCKIPKYAVNSHAEYMAAAQDDELTIEGIVVAINSKDAGNKYNHLFLADTSVTGGYYCYSITQDPVKDLGIQVGMTVKVTGPMAPYSGMQEIKNGQVAILDSTIKTVETVDITEAFTAGESLAVYVGLPVVIKGVEIGTQDLEKDTSQYLYFSIGEQKGYVRTYVTDFPTTIKADDKGAIDADHAAHFGYKADATGILVLYNGAPYLIPMSTTPFTNYEEIIKTPAEKLEAEKEALKIGNSFSEDTTIELSSKGKYYDDVTITWATDNTTNAAIANNKLSIVVPEEALTVKITATIKCGDLTDTKVFEITLSKKPVTIPEALEIADGSNVFVSGTVVKINTEWSDQYGNISVTIADDEGNELYLYRLATKVALGDIITVKGKMDTYNNARQVAAGATATVDDPAPVEVSLTEAVALEDGRRVIVKGTVKEINTEWSDQYGNITVTIEDAAGNTLYIYRMKTNVKVGDVVTISGKVGSYNGSKQIAAGATAVIEGDETETEEPEVTTEAEEIVVEGSVSLSEAIALADGTDVIVSGTVTDIGTPWNDTYGNISVTISDKAGNSLYVYRLTTKVELGDIITVTGKMGSYSGNKQVAQGSTAVINGHVDVSIDYTYVTIPEALKLADDAYIAVTGTVKSVDTAWSDSYGNISVTIEDADGNTLYVYRLATKVEEGDSITVYGKMGSYNGARQVAQGATATFD